MGIWIRVDKLSSSWPWPFLIVIPLMPEQKILWYRSHPFRPLKSQFALRGFNRAQLVGSRFEYMSVTSRSGTATPNSSRLHWRPVHALKLLSRKRSSRNDICVGVAHWFTFCPFSPRSQEWDVVLYIKKEGTTVRLASDDNWDSRTNEIGPG